MGSKIGFEMSLIIVEAIRGRCASFISLPATVSEIFGGQTTPSILVVSICTRSMRTNSAQTPVLSPESGRFGVKGTKKRLSCPGKGYELTNTDRNTFKRKWDIMADQTS